VSNFTGATNNVTSRLRCNEKIQCIEDIEYFKNITATVGEIKTLVED